MSSSCCAAPGSPGSLGQSMFETVATHTPRNSRGGEDDPVSTEEGSMTTHPHRTSKTIVTTTTLRRRIAWLSALVFAALALTVLTTKQHYAIDIVGGLVTATLGILLGNRYVDWATRRDRKRA